MTKPLPDSLSYFLVGWVRRRMLVQRKQEKTAFEKNI
jgi:hypothetical protein